jgi:hypothetical protein
MPGSLNLRRAAWFDHSAATANGSVTSVGRVSRILLLVRFL